MTAEKRILCTPEERTRVIEYAKVIFPLKSEWPEVEKRFREIPDEMVREILDNFDAAAESMKQLQEYIDKNGGSMAECLRRQANGTAVE